MLTFTRKHLRGSKLFLLSFVGVLMCFLRAHASNDIDKAVNDWLCLLVSKESIEIAPLMEEPQMLINLSADLGLEYASYPSLFGKPMLSLSPDRKQIAIVVLTDPKKPYFYLPNCQFAIFDIPSRKGFVDEIRLTKKEVFGTGLLTPVWLSNDLVTLSTYGEVNKVFLWEKTKENWSMREPVSFPLQFKGKNYQYYDALVYREPKTSIMKGYMSDWVHKAPEDYLYIDSEGHFQKVTYQMFDGLKFRGKASGEIGDTDYNSPVKVDFESFLGGPPMFDTEWEKEKARLSKFRFGDEEYTLKGYPTNLHINYDAGLKIFFWFQEFLGPGPGKQYVKQLDGEPVIWGDSRYFGKIPASLDLSKYDLVFDREKKAGVEDPTCKERELD